MGRVEFPRPLIERNEVKHYGNEICRARYGTVFWNS